jgi:hypothetical protein
VESSGYRRYVHILRVSRHTPKGDYRTIPYRDLGAPPVTLWEHRNALQKLHADGLKSVDEKLIFQTIAEQRELTAAAKLRTRSARLAHARNTVAESKSTSVESTSDQPDQNGSCETPVSVCAYAQCATRFEATKSAISARSISVPAI